MTENIGSHFGDNIPFRNDLVKSDVNVNKKNKRDFFESKVNSQLIIRTESLDDLRNRCIDGIDPIELIVLGNRLYKELEAFYGILVSVGYVLSKDDEGSNVVYGVSNKIKGERLDRLKITPEIIEKIEKLYEKITQYYFDKISDGGYYLADIAGASQYIYGTKEGDSNSDIYLVDIDLYVREGIVALYNVILWLSRRMIFMERKCGKKFNEARNIFEKILNKPRSQDLSQEKILVINTIIKKIKGYIENTIAIDNEDAHPIFSNL